jgi:hypothetical protein
MGNSMVDVMTRINCMKNYVYERKGVGGGKDGDNHRSMEGFPNTRSRRVNM